MWPRHVVVLMCAAAAPLGEYGLEDPTAASGVQPIVQFLMAGEGYQKRGAAHFVVRRLRAVRALADDDFAMAWDLRSGTDTLWRATMVDGVGTMRPRQLRDPSVCCSTAASTTHVRCGTIFETT